MIEGLGEAVDTAIKTIPEGYRICLDIKKQGHTASLILPNDIAIGMGRGLTLVDEIEALVETAIKHSGERKPLTKDQLYFQRWAN